jgi:hypothetical protein
MVRPLASVVVADAVRQAVQETAAADGLGDRE